MVQRPKNKKHGQTQRAKRSTVRDQIPPVRGEDIPPEAIYIGDNNWIMPDALRSARMIEIDEALSSRPDRFRRVDGGDDTTPLEHRKYELVPKKRGRPLGSKNRAKAA